jgi:hypothetical protein
MAIADLEALGPMGSPMDPEEEKAMGMAAEADAEMDDMASMAAPDGKYSVRSLNVLVDALNKILPLFDATLPKIPTQSADVVGKLPVEIIKAIAMINQATKDAQIPDLAPSIDEMIDDRGIEMVAGKLILLAKNRDFSMFLKMKPKEAPEAEGTEVEVKVETPAAPPAMAPAEMDKLMASRMG